MYRWPYNYIYMYTCILEGSTDLSDKLDIIRIEVSPSEKYKSVS